MPYTTATLMTRPRTGIGVASDSNLNLLLWLTFCQYRKKGRCATERNGDIGPTCPAVPLWHKEGRDGTEW